MPQMRAKMELVSVQEQGTPVSQEILTFRAVSRFPYGDDGASEDNTYARYTPNASLQMTVNNPALLGSMKQGEKYYLDFTKADE